MKPPRKPKKKVRKRSNAGKRLVKSVKQATDMVRDWQPGYAAVGERVKVPLSMPPAVKAYMDELQPATGHTGYAPSYDPNHDPKPPVESTMKDIADEMRRVQDGNFYNEVRDLLIKQGDPLLEIPPPELPQGVSQGIDVVKCLGVIIVILVCCLPLAFYGGMFTQSQLPQKPRLSEINLCMHLGKHWDSAKGECE